MSVISVLGIVCASPSLAILRGILPTVSEDEVDDELEDVVILTEKPRPQPPGPTKVRNKDEELKTFWESMVLREYRMRDYTRRL